MTSHFQIKTYVNSRIAEWGKKNPTEIEEKKMYPEKVMSGPSHCFKMGLVGLQAWNWVLKC